MTPHVTLNISVLSNISTPTEATLQRDEKLAKIEITVQAIILALAVFGNGMVLLVLVCRKKKMSRMNLLILHLAVADLFVAFFNILPQLIWDITYVFYGNDFLCRSVKYFQVVAMYASSYVLLTTAIDRYMVICHPLTSHMWSTRRTHLLVLAAWCVSFLFSIPQIIIFSYVEVGDSGIYNCWGNFQPIWTLPLYITWFTCAVYVMPFLGLAFLYGRICMVVWNSMMNKEPSLRQRRPVGYQRVQLNGSPAHAAARAKLSTNPRAHVRTLSKSKIKTVKLTLTVVLCYLMCWAPFFLAQMWGAWDENAPLDSSAMVIVLLLASLNSCTNPWIYMAFSDLGGHISRWCQHRRRSHFARTSTYDSDFNFRGCSMMSKTEATNADSSIVYGNVIALEPLNRESGSTKYV